ncbi:MAG: hypothetical protein L6Q54_02995 [Leptospiraceae bacterium]|nr:hypothetical protein [Leptospiraceae bacterium]MCK6380203.1 hypothetical protein [Leptospiraceae bacterium]NUM42872.1 hypothetical protein [Leptospiraceae bacterium]
MEANEIILDKDSFLLLKSGKLDISEETISYLPIVEVAELYYKAEKKDISVFKIKDFLSGIEPMQIGEKTVVIYSGIRNFFSRKEKSGNPLLRDNLYYLLSLAIEYGFPLYVSKENYSILKHYYHDDLILLKAD